LNQAKYYDKIVAGVLAAMEELIKLLDEKLHYDGYEIVGGEILIRVSSIRDKAMCPYCGETSEQVHSRRERMLKDLPMCGKKVKILLEHKKYFCKNKSCANKTFAERYDFFGPKATKTKRLQSEILRIALTQSSVAASKYLRGSVADVGKSTICNLLKKGRDE